jgi:cytochrome c
MKKITTFIFVVILLGVFIFAYAQKEIEKKEKVDPKAELAKSVENGKKLFSDASLGTNGMSCNSCHIEGGTKDTKMGEMDIEAFDNLGAEYPQYFGLAKRVMTLDQANNWCIVYPMKGKALAWDDPKLTDLTAYVASVKAKKLEKKK